ncbi:hypothetical protein VTK73DRAFT_5284 [Phialemonium thermophilum]|uniref:Glutaredoxin domain-containing protein n=1 Tax=Phialemonium thermophilum TaxID=223376 RepID=A0ABR3WPD1_9PEZI
MPSARRIRLLLYIVLAGVVTTLFFSAQYRQARPQDPRTLQDFYHKTVHAMDHARGRGGGGGGGGGGGTGGSKGGGGDGQVVLDPDTATGGTRAPLIDEDADGDIDADDERLARERAARLREAEQKAKDLANAKAPNKPDDPSEVIGVGSSASGQKKTKKKPAGVSVDEKEEGEVEEEPESEEDHTVEVTINDFLKKSPVLIFSKSYCPFSRRAKAILLDKYAIDPAPFVVELDQHPLGAQIQQRLGEMTGLRTVPNVLVNGKNIGDSDAIAALDRSGELADKIKTYGGKRVRVTKRPPGGADKAA